MVPLYDDAFVNDTLEEHFAYLYPNIKEKEDV
jgi:hypothetical protein